MDSIFSSSSTCIVIRVVVKLSGIAYLKVKVTKGIFPGKIRLTSINITEEYDCMDFIRVI